MRSYHVFVVSLALLGLTLAGMDMLHGGWDAAASGLMFVSAVVATLAFAVLMGKADRTPRARDWGRRSG
jgi:hypothetical protein